MFLKKNQPGNAPGHSWTEPDQIIEVDDHLAETLLSIPGADFSIAEPPEATLELIPREPQEQPEFNEPDTAKTTKSPGRPKLPRDKNGNIIRD